MIGIKYKELVNQKPVKIPTPMPKIDAINPCRHKWQYGVDRSRKGAPFVRKCIRCLKGELLEGIDR